MNCQRPAHFRLRLLLGSGSLATEELANLIGFIRETRCEIDVTSHGRGALLSPPTNTVVCGSDGKFCHRGFTAHLTRGDTAYTNIALPAHIDTTYYVRAVPSRIPSLPLSSLYSACITQTDPCGLNSSTCSSTSTALALRPSFQSVPGCVPPPVNNPDPRARR